MEVRQVIRVLTALAGESAYLALVAYFLLETWRAELAHPPILSNVQTGAAAALAVALGAGYALALGVEPRGLAESRFANLVKSVLVVGIFGYFVAGAACCVTYALNEHETPGIVKAIAAGFGGYVLAYLAQAYREAFRG